jgi:hypothetical protein
MVDPADPVPNKNVLPEIVMISSIKPALTTLSYAVLHQKYVVEGLGTGKIARQLASSKTRIRAALLAHKIPFDKKRFSFNSTNIPYGYKISSDGTLVNCPKEQKIISFILKLKLEGLSIRAISDELKAKGIKTKTGKETWANESLRQVVKRCMPLIEKEEA